MTVTWCAMLVALEPCPAPAASDRRRLGGSSHRGRQAIQVTGISTIPAMKMPNSASSTARAAPPLPARDATATARAMPATATVRAPVQRFGRPRYPVPLARSSGIRRQIHPDPAAIAISRSGASRPGDPPLDSSVGRIGQAYRRPSRARRPGRPRRSDRASLPADARP